ncbi:MAG: hypothetical protein M1380_01905 [Chloroflexi bacterium]|nr:hypothetical protein [Chloroflexota bacterium]
MNAVDAVSSPEGRRALRLPATGSSRYSLLVAFACVAGVRLFLTLYMAAVAFYVHRPDLQQHYAPVGVDFLDSGWERLFLGVWQREDALWYQKIATVGYTDGDMTTQFFPLFPLLMRAVSLVTGLHPIAAGLVISDVALLAALFLLHRLLLPRFGSGVANRTLVYLSLFPTAFFLHGPFSESPMLMLAVLGFYLVSRRRWAGALVVAYLAGLARPQGVLLGMPLAVQWLKGGGRWRDLLSHRRRSLPGGLGLLTASLLGLVTFLALVDTPWRRPGTPAGEGPMATQWLAVPGTDLLFAAQRILSGAAYHIDFFGLLMAVAFLLLLVVGFARLEVGYSLYALLFFLAPLSRASPLIPLMSFSRYLLLLFPCFVVLAIWGKRRWFHLTVVLLSILLLLYWSAVFSYGVFVA